VVPAPPPTSCYIAYTTQVYLLMVPIWRSTDLVTWTRVSELPNNGSAMLDLAPWAVFGHHWAPAVLARPGNPANTRFVVWYTARDRASGKQCLGVATAATPLGPFVDNSAQPAYCQLSEQGTIDASPFVDTDGTAYLTYRSEFPARIWISRLSPDGRSIVPGTESLLLAGGAPDAMVVEAPTLIRTNALYLFYSTDSWETADYRVGVARCSAVTGPCDRMYSTAVLATRGSMAGPGGQTPFVDSAGTWRMLFHAWAAPKIGYPAGARSLRLLPLSFSPDGQVQVG
jgi:beta-xylosidase